MNFRSVAGFLRRNPIDSGKPWNFHIEYDIAGDVISLVI
jgi:hypothetical protein